MSPVGPLQGTARVVKDHAADWHNYIDKWNVLNNAGQEVIGKIVTAKLRSEYGEADGAVSLQDQCEMSIGAGDDSQDGDRTSPMPEGLEVLCNKLTHIYTSMNTLVNKMLAITKHLRGVVKLEGSLSGAEDCLIFQSWPVELFLEASVYLEAMYAKELALKKAIVESIAHVKTRNVLMTYSSSWLHQPYIDDEATVTVESMLTETGHR